MPLAGVVLLAVAAVGGGCAPAGSERAKSQRTAGAEVVAVEPSESPGGPFAPEHRSGRSQRILRLDFLGARTDVGAFYPPETPQHNRDPEQDDFRPGLIQQISIGASD
jgi:hypothetical protein